MVKARQDVRALERLREKAWRAWQTEADREERAFLDEVRPARGLLSVRTGLTGPTGRDLSDRR